MTVGISVLDRVAGAKIVLAIGCETGAMVVNLYGEVNIDGVDFIVILDVGTG